jgi:hypothetical protein
MVGLVIAQARHAAKLRAKTWHFTAYLVLKDASSLKTVCLRTERLSVPVIFFHITPWFGGELARDVSPNQSGGTTAPIDGVSAILKKTQIF